MKSKKIKRQRINRADTDGNNIIDKDELNSYIQEYYIGNVNIDKLSNAIVEHLNRCG